MAQKGASPLLEAIIDNGSSKSSEELQDIVIGLLEDLAEADIKSDKLLSLFRGSGHFREQFDKDEVPDQTGLALINIALLNSELNANELATLSAKPYVSALSASPLLLAAQSLVGSDVASAIALLKAAGPNVNNTVELAAASKVMRGAKQALNSKSAKLTKTKVAMIGNATLKTLSDSLMLNMLSNDTLLDIWNAPFDQWANLLLDPGSELYKGEFSFVVVYLSSLGITSSSTRFSYDVVDHLENGISRLSAQAGLRVILILPEQMEEERFTSTDNWSWRNNLKHEIITRLTGKVVFIDPDAVIRKIGWENWDAPYYWYQAKIPCHPNALISLGREVAITITSLIRPQIKVIACDLDNTLWGGVVGEDGWANLHLDVHSAGGPYIRLQAFLKSLAKKGIQLIAVSKNTESIAREVFEKRGDDMPLKWDDFTLTMVNWEPKSQNISKAAKLLNLRLNNFCFLDDSPFERNEVKTALPAVIVPDLPDAPEQYVSALLDTGLFHIPWTTEEDINRTKLYKSEIARKGEQAEHLDIGDYLKSLNMSILPQAFGDEVLGRVTQLVQKTNQFNLTTIRHDAATLKKFAEDDDIYTHSFRVNDRFGDSGIVGVVISRPNEDEPQSYIIDTWLLSCRVMGRTIEKGIFEHIARWHSGRGIKKLIGQMIPTDYNSPVAGLYDELGFKPKGEAQDGAKVYEYDLSQEYKDNSFVEIAKQGTTK